MYSFLRWLALLGVLADFSIEISPEEQQKNIELANVAAEDIESKYDASTDPNLNEDLGEFHKQIKAEKDNSDEYDVNGNPVDFGSEDGEYNFENYDPVDKNEMFYL